MKKFEATVFTILFVTFLVGGFGCLGAYFFDWKWHNLILALGYGEVALVFYDAAKNSIKN